MKAVIMAGGQGTRFWPVSRELYPKQLLKIGGEHTLLQETVLRLAPLVDPGDIHVVTGGKLLVDIRGQLGQIEGGESLMENIIVEPMPKNTAPAIGLAALVLKKSDPDAVMAVLPSDHLIKDRDGFHDTLKKAAALAEKGMLVVFGIKPDRPETGFGYIKAGGDVGGGGMKVERFVEKPDEETAVSYLESGDYLWNSGMFVWKASVILEEIAAHMPVLGRALADIDEALGGVGEKNVLEEAFETIDSESIDYGVLERSDKVCVLPANFDWSDLGSWSALDDVLEPGEDGNVTVGRVVSIDCNDTTFYAEDRLVAAVGLSDAIVVDTPDATLVCSKDKAQKVKDIVGILKEKGYEEYSTHKTVVRPWGSYTVLQTGPMYKIKRIEVNPGAKLSHQMHHHRSEHWVVVSGTALVTNDDKVYNVHVNESTYIPMSTKHRLENPGKVPLQIIEVQNGQYLDEDDIVRFEDDYGRNDA